MFRFFSEFPDMPADMAECGSVSEAQQHQLMLDKVFEIMFIRSEDLGCPEPCQRRLFKADVSYLFKKPVEYDISGNGITF